MDDKLQNEKISLEIKLLKAQQEKLATKPKPPGARL